MSGAKFSESLLAWHARAGRHELPWQQPRTPYRVWISEIMLQQTQVQTVIPYYTRFLARFPDVRTLGAAPLDEVLHLWSGLGYYARARNLHRAAREVCAVHGGAFPQEFAAVAALPGIGRSTAGAILALACGQHHPILDGNARRVLARHFAIGGPAHSAAVQARLWRRAAACTPAVAVADYTQAIMDLGATVCTRTRPRCDVCPVAASCRARAGGQVLRYPGARRRTARSQRTAYLLVALSARGEVLLERRPPQGIWGGLWSLPEFTSLRAARDHARRALGTRLPQLQSLAPRAHRFTHFDLQLRPLLLRCRDAVAGGQGVRWYNIRQPARIGLPAPVTALLEELSHQELGVAA
ncbi:MAG: A/G-specific adenine glycosylase [Gammaproteobacteria bacterium]|nr:A/G-specific adenine glycosylase [Gammaproteobacteria bacterium]